MKLLLKLLVLVSVALWILSCDSTEPTDDQKPGRRDYTWTVDTLIIPYNILQSFWGNTPTDIWAIGMGGLLNKTIYHYDGVHWSTDGLFRNLSPTSIYGFNSNDIWIGGMDGKIWHYDGNQFSQILEDSIDGFERPLFEDMCGTSPSDLFAVGYAYKSSNDSYRKGIIYHFDGIEWKEKSIPEINVGLLKILKGKSNIYYIEGVRHEPMYGDTSKIYEFDGNIIKEIYSAPENSYQLGNAINIADQVYIEFQRIIHSYNGVNFVEELNLNKNSNYVYTMFGRNLNDIFIYMEDGVAHYNGTDIVYVLKFQGPSIPIVSSLYFEKDVFFLGYDFSVNQQIIIHGKLN